MRKLVHLIAATRPNFMKVAPLIVSIDKVDWCDYKLIHTGQHYDKNMSDVFFEDLGIPTPDVNLNVGSGTHAEQTGKTMMEYEKLLFEETPDMTIVFGDVNATLACALAARKLHIPVGHVEAGMRSGDMEMPEEINRILTDHISDILWTTSQSENEILKNEGIPANKVHFVGDIMRDTLENAREKFTQRKAYEQYVSQNDYALVTLHRPHNVDTKEQLVKFIQTLESLSKKLHLIFPIHPRTEKKLKESRLWTKMNKIPNIHIIEPQGYINFMSLISSSKFVMSDSGGIQSETTYLNIPCITVRDTTEKMHTITRGTNVLSTMEEVMPHVGVVLAGKWKQSKGIEKCDGKSSDRIVKTLKNYFSV